VSQSAAVVPTKSLKRMIAVGAICKTSIYRVGDVPALPAKVSATQMCQVVDGMAVSAAYAFARLGGSAQICARVGDDDLGISMRRTLAAEGVDTSGLHSVPGTVTSQAAVIVDKHGDRLVVPFHDSSVDKSPDWLPFQDIARADILHCDARWVEGAEAAMRAANSLNVPTMIDGDVALLEDLRRLVPLATYAVFSDAGLLIYAGCDDVELALMKVGAEHKGHVGASCGPKGYFWYEGGRICSVKAPEIKVVDTLAAGDIFHGAFALALMEGKSIRDAARFACAAASLKCTRFGGRLGCPTRSEVDSVVSITYGGDDS
jgi:sulfofructose kinase